MQLPLRIDAGCGAGLQEQIFEQLSRWIVEGRLRPGARVPPSRRLALDLKVSRNTVVLAYERLAAEGYLELRPLVGTFVADATDLQALHAPSPPPDAIAPSVAQRRRARLVFRGASHQLHVPAGSAPPIDFRVGRPDARLFPERSWLESMRRVVPQLCEGQGSYGPPAGLPALRQALAEHIGLARGIRADADQILITNGSQEGLNILSRLFVRDGVTVAIEDPCYLGAADVFASYGARLAPVPVDAEGLVVEQLPENATLVYVTPAHQYPTGIMLSAQRRSQLRAWAERTAAYVVEDDYDSDFQYEQSPLAAMKADDRGGQVIYLGTFSKCLGPGLRLGYMILPQSLVASATTVKALFDNGSGWFEQALLAQLLTSGAFAHHLRRIRLAYRERRDRLIDCLRKHFGEVELDGTHGGMHLHWRLPNWMPTVGEIEQRMSAQGVGLYGLAGANAAALDPETARCFKRSLMLGYAGLEPAEITFAIERLAQACAADKREPRAGVQLA